MRATDQSVPVLQRHSRSQHTLRRPVTFSGRSLFHGFDATIRLLPADANTGIRFRRVDLDGAPDIPAAISSIQKVPRRTVLAASEECRVETVEHLVAALAGLQIDNCLVEINAPEVPAFDGSCREMCDGILDAEIQPLNESVTPLQVTSPIDLQDETSGQFLAANPCNGSIPSIRYELDYGPQSPLPSQTATAEVTPAWFYEHISSARTFVLEAEISALKQMGYGLHLTPRDIVVIGENGPIENDLRWPNEGARHKVLDCIGDLALSGRPWHADIHACRSGHHMNHELARELTVKANRDTEGRAA